MDFTNAYGVRPLLPFSGRWFAWGIMPIVDIILLGLLIAAWIIPALFRLISEEVGASKPGLRVSAFTALACVGLIWGLRESARTRVLGQLDSHNYAGEAPLRLGAFPTVLNPFEWTGVVETDSAFHILPANALDNDVEVERARLLHKPSPSPVLAAAKKTQTATIFYDFARFPWEQVNGLDQGFEFAVHDLRFASPHSERLGFELIIRFDQALRVVSESFHF
jgi:inner membrane protein